MPFERKTETKPTKYLTESREYKKAKEKLDTFLKKICRVYISNKRDIFPDLMFIKADMVNWEKTLSSDILRKIKTNKIYIFIKKIMEEDTVTLLEKYLR